MKHLNPRQGITTARVRRGGGAGSCQCETPKSPPGDYNCARCCDGYSDRSDWCETPKSPPGDYNLLLRHTFNIARTILVCETPKSPPGDYNSTSFRLRTLLLSLRVKHLNPRQGITTNSVSARVSATISDGCETPKSPPGDYNSSRSPSKTTRTTSACETPKSPPGDYNPVGWRATEAEARRLMCETPKSPPGDYNTASMRASLQRSVWLCVKHLNPRQGITTGDY